MSKRKVNGICTNDATAHPSTSSGSNRSRGEMSRTALTGNERGIVMT
jgi:hypothetical protein